MYTYLRRLFGPRALLTLLLAAAVFGFSTANAAVVSYSASLAGANESPPVASPATGFCTVDIDAFAHTMRVQVTFNELVAVSTNSHIHAATAVAGVGNAGVATTTPTFAGFPGGVTAGVYDNTLDMTLASSYNPAYVAAHGGTTAQAEADLFQAIADGKAYLNVHSQFAPGGEIRGFLLPIPLPTAQTTWGQIKALYR